MNLINGIKDTCTIIIYVVAKVTALLAVMLYFMWLPILITFCLVTGLMYDIWWLALIGVLLVIIPVALGFENT